MNEKGNCLLTVELSKKQNSDMLGGTLTARRKRDRHIMEEFVQIQRRMTEAGISNAGTYMRKMTLNGYILHVDLATIKELVSL